MKIVEIDSIENLMNERGTFYIKDSNLKVWIGADQVRITDLTNALKRGKEYYSVSISYWGKHYADFLNVFMKLGTFANIYEAFVNVAKNQEFDYQIELPHPNFTVYVSKDKANRLFSPFALSNLKPLKEEPKKWTMAHVHKALANGQFEGLQCDGRYTDDYAFDAAYNFGKGEVKAPISLLKDLIESPSGWWVMLRDGVVDFNCHSFLGYSFKFIVESELELA